MAIFYSLEVSLAISFFTILKIVFWDSWPSFEDSWLMDHNSHFCENDYGMPSNHTLLSVNLLLIYYK